MSNTLPSLADILDRSSVTDGTHGGAQDGSLARSNIAAYAADISNNVSASQTVRCTPVKFAQDSISVQLSPEAPMPPLVTTPAARSHRTSLLVPSSRGGNSGSSPSGHLLPPTFSSSAVNQAWCRAHRIRLSRSSARSFPLRPQTRRPAGEPSYAHGTASRRFRSCTRAPYRPTQCRTTPS